MKLSQSISLLSNDLISIVCKKLRIDLNHHYYKNVMNIQDSNDLIWSSLKSDKPIMVARCGTVECQAVYKYLHDMNGLPIGSPILHILCNNAGFFPEDKEMWWRFGELMLDSMNDVDIQGVMWSGGGENYLLKHYAPQSQLIPVRALDPIYGWTEALENRKILVIHPFVETFKSQYETNRRKIYEGSNFLPSFNLLTLKAVQTIAGTKDERFTNWFEALDYMTEQVVKLDFDIALIGCGAYGYPLASRIKRMGKKAIHMGGALQLLFGVKGQRWENDPRILKYINDSWVRPSKTEVPLSFMQVENGCYW